MGGARDVSVWEYKRRRGWEFSESALNSTERILEVVKWR
jgi:hypothetical protein